MANGEQGSVYTYNFFVDPDSDYEIRLKLGYTEKTEEELIIGAGIFPKS